MNPSRIDHQSQRGSARACALYGAAVLAASLGAGAIAYAETSTRAGSPAEARFRQERADCLSGASRQERSACLKEAQSSFAEARAGELGRVRGSTDLNANASVRCAPLAGDEREDCLSRSRGEGAAHGRPEDGGVLRESRRLVPGYQGDERQPR